jgi:hypothetical protein
MWTKAGRAFFKKTYIIIINRNCEKRAGELFNLSRNQVKIMTGLLTEQCNSKGHLSNLGNVNSPECDRCNQASEMASHVLCDCEALATLRFRHVGCHLMHPDD